MHNFDIFIVMAFAVLFPLGMALYIEFWGSR